MTPKFITIWSRDKDCDVVVQSVSLTNAYQIEITNTFVHVSYSDTCSYLHNLRRYEFATLEENKLPKGYKTEERTLK